MKNDLIYLRHVLKSIERIESFLTRIKQDQFLKSVMRINAVVRELEVIGEASSKISSAFRKKYSEIPWGEMKSTRNFLIHQYFSVDAKEVWKTAKNDIPQLKKVVEKVLGELDA